MHIEYANQALSQTIAAAPDVYAIGVVLTPHATFRANGREVDGDTVFIVPPGVDFHLFSPPEASILACVINRDLFDAQYEVASDFPPWRAGASGALTFLKGSWLAERLRQDAYSSLRAVSGMMEETGLAADLAKAFVQSFAASLLLNWPSLFGQDRQHYPATFNRFRAIRDALQSDANVHAPFQHLEQELAISKRSIQYALANEVSLSVMGYQRHLRLHAVRRALRQGLHGGTTIGDLAAQHGFWNWSHFSQKYSQLFGELPSETHRSYLAR